MINIYCHIQTPTSPQCLKVNTPESSGYFPPAQRLLISTISIQLNIKFSYHIYSCIARINRHRWDFDRHWFAWVKPQKPIEHYMFVSLLWENKAIQLRILHSGFVLGFIPSEADIICRIRVTKTQLCACIFVQQIKSKSVKKMKMTKISQNWFSSN